MLSGDKELLERELRAAERTVGDFCKQAAAVKVSLFDKTANIFFGKEGDPNSSDIARDNSRILSEYHRGVLFVMNTPSSLSAVENDLLFLSEQLHLAENERKELEPNSIVGEVKRNFTGGFPFGSKDSMTDSDFNMLADFGGERSNPVGPYAMIEVLDQLVSLKILKIVA
ncbi:MAG TPA: hypothetical protein VI685_22635, partial [Candidatus Angelobacter sp.]